MLKIQTISPTKWIELYTYGTDKVDALCNASHGAVYEDLYILEDYLGNVDFPDSFSNYMKIYKLKLPLSDDLGQLDLVY